MDFLTRKILYLNKKISTKRWQIRNKNSVPIIDFVYQSAQNIIVSGWCQTYTHVDIRIISNDDVTNVGRVKRVKRSDVENVAGPAAGYESFHSTPDFRKFEENSELIIEIYINHQLARIEKISHLVHSYSVIRDRISQDFNDGILTLENAVENLLPSLIENNEICALALANEPVDVLYDHAEHIDFIKLLIVIPLYKNLGLLEHQLLLFSQFRLKHPEEIFHVVFVVDDPFLKTQAKSKISLLNDFVFNLPITVISNHENSGFAISCNNGFKLKKSKYTLFWNSDLYTTDVDSIAKIIKLFESDEMITAISPVLCNPDGIIQCTSLIRKKHPEHTKYQILDPIEKGKSYLHGVLQNTDAKILSGGALATRSSDFKCVGGFSTKYGQGDFEDGELTIRLGEIGRLQVIDVQFFHLMGHSYTRNVVETLCRSEIFSKFCNMIEEKRAK